MKKNTLSKDLDVDILGHLFWYSVGTVNITRSELQDLLYESKLSDEWLPRPISKNDAFRRATNEIQTSKRMSNQTKYFNYLVREVYNDKDYIQRNIIIENVNKKQSELNYNSRAAILYFNKNDGEFTYYNESDIEEVEEVCQNAKYLFQIYSTSYNEQHIRSMVLNILRTLSPIAMKKDGNIYFIPRHLEDELLGLTNFVNLLADNEAYQVPLIDTEDNQAMVLSKLNVRYDYLLSRANQDDKLRKDQLNLLIKDIRLLTDEFEKIEELLSVSNDELNRKNTRLKLEVFRLSKS